MSFAYAQIGSQDLGAEEMTASVFVEEGKILFVGSSGKQIALLKVLENGVPDSMFGVEGKVRLSLNSDDFGDFDVLNITSSVKQGDNILVSGYTRKDPPYKTVAFIARLTPTGAFDTDFNESGIRIIKFPALQGHLDGGDDDRLLDVIVHGDKILGVGSSTSASKILRFNTIRSVAVVQLTKDGAFDTTFDDDGYGIYNFDPSDSSSRHYGKTITPISDSKLIVGARLTIKLLTFIINTDGSLDTSYGSKSNGHVIQRINPNVHNFEPANISIVKQGETILVASSNRRVVTATSHDNFISLVRYNLNGTLDTTFDNDGLLEFSFRPGENNGIGSKGLILNGDKILIGGYTGELGYNEIQNSNNFAIAQLNNDGSIDTSFGTNGMTIFDYSNHRDELTAIKIVNDRILAAGVTGVVTDVVEPSGRVIDSNFASDFALGWLNLDGSLGYCRINTSPAQFIEASYTNATLRASIDGGSTISAYNPDLIVTHLDTTWSVVNASEYSVKNPISGEYAFEIQQCGRVVDSRVVDVPLYADQAKQRAHLRLERNYLNDLVKEKRDERDVAQRQLKSVIMLIREGDESVELREKRDMLQLQTTELTMDLRAFIEKENEIQDLLNEVRAAD